MRTATQGGAEALGFDDLGRIAPGAQAAFAFAEGPPALPDPLALPPVRRGAAARGRGREGARRSRARLRPHDQVLALRVRAALRPGLGGAGGAGARSAGASWRGSWWPWSARAARPWDSTAWPTRPSTRATRARPAASCRAACSRAARSGLFVLSPPLALVGAAAMLNPLCLALSPGGPARRLRLLVHQEVHVPLAPRAGPRPRHRARGRVARRPRPVRAAARGARRWPSWPGWPASTPSTPARTSTSTGARDCTPCPRASASRRALAVARAFTSLAVVLLAARVHAGAAASDLPGRGGGGGRAPRLRALPGDRGRPLARRRRLLHRERLDQRRLPRLHVLGLRLA